MGAVEGRLIAQDAPRDPRQLVGQGCSQLVAMQPWSCVAKPCSEAEALPIVGAHQNHFCSLDEQGPEVLSSALGDAPQDGSAAGAVLPWNETKPHAEVLTNFEHLAGADGGHHGGRDQWADAGNAHEATAVGFLLTNLLDLVGKGLDPLVEIYPVIVETAIRVRIRRYLVLTVLQDRLERVAQSPGASRDRDALLNQEARI
jgi:hypothetical protein